MRRSRPRSCTATARVLPRSMRANILSPKRAGRSDLKYIGVKSTNHFYAAYAPLATKVLYCDGEGPSPLDARKYPFTKARRTIRSEIHWREIDQPLLRGLCAARDQGPVLRRRGSFPARCAQISFHQSAPDDLAARRAARGTDGCMTAGLSPACLP